MAKLAEFGEDKSSQCVFITSFGQGQTAGRSDARACQSMSWKITLRNVAFRPRMINMVKLKGAMTKGQAAAVDTCIRFSLGLARAYFRVGVAADAGSNSRRLNYFMSIH